MTILEAQSRVGGRVKTFREGFSDGLHAEGKVHVLHSFLGLLFGHQVRYSEENLMSQRRLRSNIVVTKADDKVSGAYVVFEDSSCDNSR